MRTQIFLIVIFSILSSCSISNRIVEINDSYKGIKGFRLDQNPKAFSAERIGTVWGQHVLYPFSSTYIYEEDGKNRPKVSAKFQIRTTVSAGGLDSVLFFNLDGEKIRLVANDFKKNQVKSHETTSAIVSSDPDKGGKAADDKISAIQTTSADGYQLMNLSFIVPENLWVSIAAADTIQYRLYCGKEGIDAKLNLLETSKLKDFFKRADASRAKLIPAIPEGMKKW